jgi:cytochrome c1
MKWTKVFLAAMAVPALMFASSGTACASEGHDVALKQAVIDVTDQTQIRRGLTVFTEVCMGCHSAKYVTYKGLMDYPEIGITREEADELRGDKPLTSGMITDLGPEDAAMSYGKVPPDLSLIVPGRRGGADYIYSLLTGFEHDHEGKVPDGNYNTYFVGNRIAMPDPLGWLDHDKGDEAELIQQAHDVAAFLTFIADPHQNERRYIGMFVMGFLLILTLVLYLLKREIWKDVKH